MIAFEAPPTGEALENTHAWSFHRRIIIAVMTLLMGVAAVALVAANENAASSSIHTVFACGDTPGFCPNPPMMLPTPSALPPRRKEADEDCGLDT
jgi:hypothetical protein